jgi:hypothetical protein
VGERARTALDFDHRRWSGRLVRLDSDHDRQGDHNEFRTLHPAGPGALEAGMRMVSSLTRGELIQPGVRRRDQRSGWRLLRGDRVVIVVIGVVMVGVVIVTRHLPRVVVIPVREGRAGHGKAARDREQAGEQAVGQGPSHEGKLMLAPVRIPEPRRPGAGSGVEPVVAACAKRRKNTGEEIDV